MKTESKEVSKCSHKNITSIDNTCIKCTDCGALSYHRDSGGVGQPKERVWLTAHLPTKEVSNVSEYYITNIRNVKDKKGVYTYTFADLREVGTNELALSATLDYINQKIERGFYNLAESKEEPLSVSVEEAANEHPFFRNRKQVMYMKNGLSESDFNEFAEESNAIIGELLEALKSSHDLLVDCTVKNVLTGKEIWGKSKQIESAITKATNYLNQQ